MNGGDDLDTHTILLSARHYSALEYNVHNLYGHLEGIGTLFLAIVFAQVTD